MLSGTAFSFLNTLVTTFLISHAGTGWPSPSTLTYKYLVRSARSTMAGTSASSGIAGTASVAVSQIANSFTTSFS